MKRHIFLTGDLQVGKSYIIRKILAETNFSPGGFLTLAGEKDPRDLFLVPINFSENFFSEKNLIAHRGTEFKIFPEVFDILGTKILDESLGANLIIMDELGFLESDAKIFQKKVFEVLDGEVSVLGVVRDRKAEFLDCVRNHPKVEVVRVTKENREEMYSQVLDLVLCNSAH